MNPLDEVVLVDEDGGEVAVADLWAERPVALIFLRHYGWLHCRYHAMQLHRARDRLAATGGEVWLVGMGTPAHARAFKEETGVGFPILLSRDKEAYRAMDLRRGSTLEVFSPRTIATGPLRALGVGAGRARGGNISLRPAQQDWHQFGGAFVFAPGGELVFEHRSRDPGDLPAVEELERALEQASGN